MKFLRGCARFCTSTSFLIAFPALSQAQSSSLADYLKSTRIDSPYIVISPESVPSTQKRVGLSQFERKLIRVGSLSAVVPEKMISIDDSFQKEPDYYDGLPRQSKVIYLMALLNKSQWDKAVENGIGLSDLSGEQRNVFLSLLPKPFSWSTVKVDKEGIPEEPANPQTLSTDATKQVRLRLTRGLTLVPTSGRSFFYMDIGGRGQTPGETVKVRDREEDLADGTLYGVQIRKVVDNRQKPSDLNFSEAGLNVQINLKGSQTIAELLAEVSSATRKQIVASPYISHLRVQSSEGQVRAGDLLAALAQSVTGTYRKVGRVMFLTSDLRGAGSRQLNLALWASAVQQEVARREAEGITKIANSGFLRQIGFDSDTIFSPTDSMKAQILAEEGGERKTIGVSELPKAVQTQLEATGKFMRPPVQYTETGITSRFLFAFVLPNGDHLEPEREELGMSESFYRPPAAEAPRMELNPRSMGPFKIAKPEAKSVVLRVDNVESAIAAVELAQTYGFSEVWLEALNPGVLKAAVDKAAGGPVKISLAIRPWKSAGNVRDIDLNLLGQRIKQTRNTFPLPNALPDDQLFSGDFTQRLYDTTEPESTSRFDALTTVPGVYRIMVLDTSLPGYRSESATRGTSLSQAASVGAGKLGYSVSMREQFLLNHGIDPFDIPDENCRIPIDLRQPYFEDYRLGPSTGRFQRTPLPNGVEGLAAAWSDFRAKTQSSAVIGVLQNLGKARLPIFVYEGEMDTRSGFRSEKSALDWPASPTATSLGLLFLPGNVPADMVEKLVAVRLDTATRSQAVTAIDLSGLQRARWNSFFAKWFVRAAN